MIRLALIITAVALTPSRLPATDRLSHPGLAEAILAAVTFLDETQVRDRPGRGSPLCDASDLGDGCRGRTSLNLKHFEDVGLPWGHVRNRVGGWASFLHFVPTLVGHAGRAPIALQDSCCYVTTSTAYGLLLIDDSRAARTLRFALDDVAGYRRAVGYNFYPELPGGEGRSPRVGPPNVPVKQLRRAIEMQLRHPPGSLPSPLNLDDELAMRHWLKALVDPCQNPTGADAMFNGPDDADDTALAVTLQCHGGARTDLEALAEVIKYRDVGRDREHRRNGWKGRDSGAFLSWIKDEREPPFARPESGVMAMATNDVDAVVNANVVGALARVGWRDAAGYAESVRLLARVCDERLWPAAGTYYPNRMSFPYAVSRAFRDGGVREEPLASSMRRVLGQLLDETTCRGTFRGGRDVSDHFSTALGLCALLNLGRPMACELGRTDEFDRAVSRAAAYLIRLRGEWESGLFTDSTNDLLHYRSKAMTVGAVLEALTKYALVYDLDDAAFASRRLGLRSTGGGRVGLIVVKP